MAVEAKRRSEVAGGGAQDRSPHTVTSEMSAGTARPKVVPCTSAKRCVFPLRAGGTVQDQVCLVTADSSIDRWIARERKRERKERGREKREREREERERERERERARERTKKREKRGRDGGRERGRDRKRLIDWKRQRSIEIEIDGDID